MADQNHFPHNQAFDDDGRLKQQGTVWTAAAHIVTALIGSGILSSAWATSQLGWTAAPFVMLLFSCVTYYTSTLLAACYCPGDPVTGKRNYTYMDAVRSNLGGMKYKIFALFLYLNAFSVAVGYTTSATISMKAIQRSTCRQNGGSRIFCHMSSNILLIIYCITQAIFSQIFYLDSIRWFCTIVSVFMTCTFTSIGFAQSVAKIAETGKLKGSPTGISIGAVTETQKIWRIFKALDYIAFAFSYFNVLFAIEDKLKSPPSEAETMKKASLIGVGVATLFYMLFGCFGYAAFGDLSPPNLLTAFDNHSLYWLVDIANAAVVIHLTIACQVYCQPVFLFIEKKAVKTFSDTEFITKEIKVPIPGLRVHYNLNLFRLIWRTIFVVIITVIPLLYPFFNDVVGLLGTLGFWPLAVYFPVEMYVVQKKIPKWSTKRIGLEILRFACLIISTAAAAGAIAGVARAQSQL